MQRFRTRSDIIIYAQERAPSRSCRRAFEHTVELLGAFDPLTVHGYPGWLLRVTSVHKREWLVAVAITPIANREPVVVWVDEIHWERWAGNPARTPATLYEGDNPGEYARCCKEAIYDRADRETGRMDTTGGRTEDSGDSDESPVHPPDDQ